jgi:2-polyprenyl-3-methyl-5-hydroxy-6-metoxy-1,4-benzoquinol methylase
VRLLFYARRVDDEDARRMWNESADAYNAFVERGLDYYRTDFHGPALLEACGDVRGLRALDVGCGQGWFSRELVNAGAVVTGVDWSEKQIEHAIRIGQGPSYELLDAATIAERFASGSFDIVTGCMSLMDMPRPGAVLDAARRVLVSDGRIVFSVPNPVTESPYRVWKRDGDGKKLALEIDRYFDADTTVMHWNMPRLTQPFRTVQYRFTLEMWSRMIEEAGLVIRRLREPRPSATALAKRPEMADAARLPYILIFELQTLR